jgi:hypothetical protein
MPGLQTVAVRSHNRRRERGRADRRVGRARARLHRHPLQRPMKIFAKVGTRSREAVTYRCYPMAQFRRQNGITVRLDPVQI